MSRGRSQGHGFRAEVRSPWAEPAATGSGGGHTGDTLRSRLGCRTGSALVARASGGARSLEAGEGRDGAADEGRKQGRCNVKDTSDHEEAPGAQEQWTLHLKPKDLSSGSVISACASENHPSVWELVPYRKWGYVCFAIEFLLILGELIDHSKQMKNFMRAVLLPPPQS